MADNVVLNPGADGDTIAADDVGGVKYQVVKLAVGADGSANLVANANPIPVGDAGGSLTVDNGGTFAVQVSAALPAGTNNIGDVDVLSIVPGTGATDLGKAEDAAHTSGDTGVMALAVRRDANTSIVSADGDYAPLLVNDTGSLKTAITAGGIPGATQDSAVASEGVQIMLDARSADPTAVGTGDAVRALATLTGKQVVVPYAIPASTWAYASPAAVTDTSDDVAKANAAGLRNYITGIQVFNSHDTQGTAVVIKDGSTVIWQGWAEQAGGGCSAKFDPPLRGTVNTAVNVANVSSGAATFFNLQGFQAAE